MSDKKFIVGKSYYAPALYGGTYVIEVVDRTETEISVRYNENTSDDRSVFTIPIEHWTDGTECAKAWKYHSPYAPKDEFDYGYYAAVNGY